MFDATCLDNVRDWQHATCLDLGWSRRDGRFPSKTVLQPGDYVAAYVDEADVSTLKATPLFKTTLTEFSQHQWGSSDLNNLLHERV